MEKDELFNHRLQKAKGLISMSEESSRLLNLIVKNIDKKETAVFWDLDDELIELSSNDTTIYIGK